jgi:hypothetical protein
LRVRGRKIGGGRRRGKGRRRRDTLGEREGNRCNRTGRKGKRKAKKKKLEEGK